MQEMLCELRFDIPLADRATGPTFERAWRDELSAQRMTALAMPPAQALAARFRVCGSGDTSELDRYLPTRLAALPGSPVVAREPSEPVPGWSGVRVWLSYRAQDLPALLGKAKTHPKKTRTRGPRP